MFFWLSVLPFQRLGTMPTIHLPQTFGEGIFFLSLELLYKRTRSTVIGWMADEECYWCNASTRWKVLRCLSLLGRKKLRMRKEWNLKEEVFNLTDWHSEDYSRWADGKAKKKKALQKKGHQHFWRGHWAKCHIFL